MIISITTSTCSNIDLLTQVINKEPLIIFFSQYRTSPTVRLH